MKWIRVFQHFFDVVVEGREFISLELGTSLLEPDNPQPQGDCCGSQSLERRPYHLNASGPFYSVSDGCITCLAPQAAAPDLMECYEDLLGTNAQSHCFFAQQPQTSEELDQAINALEVSCIENIRYSGSDPAILKRLCEMGYRHLCDVFEDDYNKLH